VTAVRVENMPSPGNVTFEIRPKPAADSGSRTSALAGFK
jgi:hypothetical protein